MITSENSEFVWVVVVAVCVRVTGVVCVIVVCVGFGVVCVEVTCVRREWSVSS